MEARRTMKYAFLCIMAVCLGFGLAGCGAGKSPAVPPQDAPAADSAQPAPPVSEPEPPVAAVVKPIPEEPPAEKPADVEKAPAGDAVTGGKPEPAASEPPVKTADGNTDMVDVPGERDFSLTGIRIGDSKETVVKKHGKPNGEFTMDDGDDPLLVYEYRGFSIGFAADGRVEFVTVQSAEADPGLGGLKIGSPTADARKSLGEPDGSSSYVLTYKSEGAVLKLDVDPKREVIHSIKLFQSN